jgi:branched-chain amino acid aminotransferase
MPTSVFLNGRFFTLDDSASERAALSPFDAGFQHGVGLFETMLGGVSDAGGGAGGATGAAGAQEVWCMRIDEHLSRLSESARQLGLSESLRTGALAEAVAETVRRSGLARARIRLTITGGDLNLLTRASAQAASTAAVQHDPTVLIVAQPAVEYPAGMFERGVAVSIADARANPFNPLEGHKTLNYWWRLRELQAASAKNAAEAIVLSVSNHLVSGCVSNLLLVSGGEILTPIARGEEGGGSDRGRPASDDPDSPPMPTLSVRGGYLPSPALPGIVRSWALEWAADQGIAVKRQMLSVADLLEADEVLLTNSSWGVLPVVKVEGSAVGDAVPGPVGTQLASAWRALIEEYASGAA